jgi:pimeloyl-ACP methyl ester carboxylesterase
VKSEHAAHLKSLAPEAEVVTIPGVGHMVSGDENELFTAAILNFISMHVSGTDRALLRGPLVEAQA